MAFKEAKIERNMLINPTLPSLPEAEPLPGFVPEVTFFLQDDSLRKTGTKGRGGKILLPDKILATQKRKRKKKTQVSFYFADLILSTDTYLLASEKIKVVYLLMPLPLEEARTKRRNKVLITVGAAFKGWLSISAEI